jgi:hypothetical protein
MKFIIFLSIFTFSFINIQVDKKSFYETLSSNSIEELNQMINKIERKQSNSLANAYKGTLIAKKSSFLKNTTEKIKTFKAGVNLLETEIEKFPKNVEYRFLRLTIQENCPKILKYDKNIEKDIEIITNEFSTLDKELKEVIANFAKTSSGLKSSNLK